MHHAFESVDRNITILMARTTVVQQIMARTVAGTVNLHITTTNPNWDPNWDQDRQALKQYQRWILFNIKNAVPKAVNWSKLHEIKQDINESPSGFVERLKEVMHKYTAIDPESEEGRKGPLRFGKNNECGLGDLS